jgi:general secretion pathway protein G
MSHLRQAFTLLEITFVIVIIGILTAIAIPKFAATRDDALITKGKDTLAAVRSSIASEKQKRILRGDFTPITDLSAGGEVFDLFSADKDGNNNRVLEYPPKSCTDPGCWSGSGTSYTFHAPNGESDCTYTLSNNRLTTTDCSVFGE